LVKFLLHVLYKKKIQLIDFIFNQTEPINNLLLLVYKLLFKKKRYYTPPGSFFSFFFFYFKRNKYIHAKRRRFSRGKFLFNFYIYESLITKRVRFNKPKIFFVYKTFNVQDKAVTSYVVGNWRSKKFVRKNLFYNKKQALNKARNFFYGNYYRKKLFYPLRFFFNSFSRKKNRTNNYLKFIRYKKNFLKKKKYKSLLQFFVSRRPKFGGVWFKLNKKLPFFLKKSRRVSARRPLINYKSRFIKSARKKFKLATYLIFKKQHQLSFKSLSNVKISRSLR
jgi:hypothetical protein